jgi:hypothetical protein
MFAVAVRMLDSVSGFMCRDANRSGIAAMIHIVTQRQRARKRIIVIAQDTLMFLNL